MVSSSDSEEDAVRVQGYTPVLAATQSLRVQALPRSTSEAHYKWPEGGVSTYTNTLYKNYATADARPISAGQRANMQAQKSIQAQRRAQRMQGGMYTSNDGGMHGAQPSPRLLMATQEQHHQPSSATAHRPAGGDVYGMKASFDPNEGNEQDAAAAEEEAAAAEQRRISNSYRPASGMPRGTMDPSSFGITRSASSRPSALAPQPPLMGAKDIRSFLMAPGPKNEPIACYIVREKGGGSAVSALTGGKSNAKYSLYLEDGKRFLMAARKRKGKTTSNYLVSLDSDDLKRDSGAYFGKLRSNFVGSDFTIYDAGVKPEKKKAKKNEEEDEEEDDYMERQQLGCVTYQYNVLGTRGPRKMTAVIPQVNAYGQSVFSPSTPGDNILDRVKKDSQFHTSNLVVMHNKTPRWNEELNAYCLNFHGRVTEASVKNFQLVTDDNASHVILQFGKTGKHTFTMDYQYPMSALQAFCICLSSFDDKLACE